MKIIIPQEKIKEGLNIVERIVSKSITLPILNNIQFKTDKNFLNLSATDLEVGINWWVLSKTEEEGVFILPSQIISSLVGFLPPKPVTFVSKDSSVEISCQDYNSKIKTLDPNDFPVIPLLEDGLFLEIPALLFCRSLSQVVSLASSGSRPEISGVYLAFQKNIMKVVATDSFRLAEKTIIFKKSEGPDKEYSLILPAKAAREVINIFGQKEGNIKIYFSPNHVMFESLMQGLNHPQAQFVSRMIEGEFPNYQEIIPQKSDCQLSLPKKEFLNQIKSASIFSGKVNEVKLIINPVKNEVEILSQSQDLGEHKSKIRAKIKGKGLEINFNYKFLLEGLSIMPSGEEEGEEIVFEFTDEEGPAVLKPQGGSGYLYILMPIKKS